MSKLLKHILLPAKELGWELWLLGQDGWTLEKSIPEMDDSTVIPKETRIAFPVSAVATVPMVIPSADSDTQRGIAQLQMEQTGLVKSESSSWDLYQVDAESSLSAGVSLVVDSIVPSKQIQEQTFDVAARFYKVGDLDTLLCKREQGRWVTICYKNAQPFYSELTDSAESILRQIKSLLTQFSVQGIEYDPQTLIIEKDENSEWRDHREEQLKNELGIATVLVDSVSLATSEREDLKLIPGFVTESRTKETRNKKIKIAVLACLCLYAIGCLLIYMQHKQTENEIQQVRNDVAALEPQWIVYQHNLSQLSELDGLLTNQWPLATYEKVASLLPEHEKLQFEAVEVESGRVLIKGVSPNINLINELHPALMNEPYFSGYIWTVPVKAEDQKTKLWNFTMEATKKGGQ
ncbi:MAG: PilN domain-containing protein [Akkermansiaceae bacterium]